MSPTQDVGRTTTLRGLQRAVVAALHRNGQENPYAVLKHTSNVEPVMSSKPRKAVTKRTKGHRVDKSTSKSMYASSNTDETDPNPPHPPHPERLVNGSDICCRRANPPVGTTCCLSELNLGVHSFLWTTFVQRCAQHSSSQRSRCGIRTVRRQVSPTIRMKSARSGHRLKNDVQFAVCEVLTQGRF